MAASPELIDKCVHCGFCLPACPTYVLWGNEADSPRGRIYLMKLQVDGAAQVDRDWVRHFDSCLGCVSCMSACPSGVPYGQLIEATRSHIESNYSRSLFDRLFRQSLFALFPRIDRLGKLRTFLGLYQKSGLQALLRATGLLRILPARLRAMEGLAPKLADAYVAPSATPAVGKKRKKVAVMLGCVQREFLGDINAATIRVLAAEGCEVLAPVEQGCCGALLVHAGEEARAVELAKKVIDTFEPLGVDAIITNAGGCGSNVKEYDHLLRNTPYAARAKAFVAKCREIGRAHV